MGKRRPLRKFLNVNIREKRINPKLRNYRMSAPEGNRLDDTTCTATDISRPHGREQRTLRRRFGASPTTEHAPPCPCAAGPGNGAAHRRAAIHCFLLDRLPTARIVTASTSAPRGPAPKGSGVLADAPTANANARPNGPKEKIRDRFNPRRHEHERQHQAFRR